MGFKAVERGGNWGVFKEGPDQRVVGEDITYEEYKRYQHKPHEVAFLFERHEGKLRRRNQ